MLGIIPEEYFVKYSSSEVTNIGASDSNRNWGLFSTMTKFLSDSYDALEETITHMKSLKLKIYPGENVTYFYAEILVDADLLDSAGTFKTEHLGYITRIFEDASESIFILWDIHK